MCFQLAPLLYKLDKASQVMAYEFLMLPCSHILPAIKPAVARRSWISQEVIYLSPSISSTRHHLLCIEPSVPLGKLSSSGPPSSGAGRLATLHVWIRNVLLRRRWLQV